jgi:hypothetical protein
MFDSYKIRWIKAGIIGGIMASILYPALLILPGPSIFVTTAASFFGLSIGVGSFGLLKLINLNRRSVLAGLGAVSNFTAGALFTAMALVQLAVKQVSIAAGTDYSLNLEAVWLGLDVAWDLYIGAGTIFFSISMLTHPRFRWHFGVPGLLLGAALLILNLIPFPTPPSAAGLVDLGPFVGLWYLVVTIQARRSLKWARNQPGQDV